VRNEDDDPKERPEWGNTTSTQMLTGAKNGDPKSWDKFWSRVTVGLTTTVAELSVSCQI
jgi:hypothetical protein